MDGPTGAHFGWKIVCCTNGRQLASDLGIARAYLHSIEEQESIAINLGNSEGAIQALKEKLAKNRATSPLFNSLLFAKNIEAAYQSTYNRYHAGLTPDHIYVCR